MVQNLLITYSMQPKIQKKKKKNLCHQTHPKTFPTEEGQISQQFTKNFYANIPSSEKKMLESFPDPPDFVERCQMEQKENTSLQFCT